MESIRVSDRLRSKRFKTGNATAEDKAYIEKKYGGECDMNGYVSPFPPGEDPYVKEWTYTPLPSNYVEKKAQKKRPERALSKDNKVVEDRVRCEVIPLSKPTLVIEEEEEEVFTKNDAIYLNSLIRDRTNKMRNLLKLDEEIERLEKKRANHVSEKCVEMTPERFRNALFDLGYIKK
jgi:hypothetical protein